MADTICALATASGRSALAVVRLSGPEAFGIARGVIGWSSGHAFAPRLASLVTIRDDDGAVVDQVLVTFFPGPASYTGEDVVEFSGHGGLVAPYSIVALLIRRGARQALPGEFTRRAVLSGRMDLIQAEAVGDLIDATSAAQARTALHQLEGGLSRRLNELRTALLDLLALLAYDIDFPDEDDGPIGRSQIALAVAAVDERIRRLTKTAPLGQRLQHGALVVFAGRPNAGKSSLFNALVGVDRAIVTDVPGTTRDAVEAAADIDGWPVRLVDTAGLRPSDDRVEQMGIEVSRRYLARADLVILCTELGSVHNDEERALADLPNVLVVRTKADLGASDEEPGLRVSVVDGSGLDRVRQSLLERLFGRDGGDGGEPLLTRERHRIGLEGAAAAMDAASLHLVPGGDTILVAHEVQRAVAFLEEVLGVVDFDSVLGRVFERFCVGK